MKESAASQESDVLEDRIDTSQRRRAARTSAQRPIARSRVYSGTFTSEHSVSKRAPCTSCGTQCSSGEGAHEQALPRQHQACTGTNGPPPFSVERAQGGGSHLCMIDTGVTGRQHSTGQSKAPGAIACARACVRVRACRCLQTGTNYQGRL